MTGTVTSEDAGGSYRGIAVDVFKVDSLATEPDVSSVSRLPEHLRCMTPPVGLLTTKQTEEVVDLVLEYQDIFIGPDGKVGFTNRVRHTIDVQGAQPVKVPNRRKSIPDKEHIAAEVQKLEREGQIRKSMSPWAAQVVLANKKDGTKRFCIDFRQLNDLTKKDAYPLPRIDECLDVMNRCQFFSSMDLASGYWQVAMDPKDREKTAFSTHVGLYEWNVMPFGLCNAPATFCRLMEQVLADIIWSKCLVYLDDIVAYGSTFRVAYENLEAVFKRLRAANLKLKPKKCQLFWDKLDYLGHEVSREGIRPSHAKIAGLHD